MTTQARRQVGLAQLSLVGTAPPDLVTIAAEAGFDFIGARVRPVTAAERAYDLHPGSPMLKETLARMRDTGVAVKDIEFLLLDGSEQREAWLRMMEAGHALGAGSLTVAGADADTARLADTLARMTEDGRDFGIVPTLEPISYQAVHSIPAAAELARAAGCNIVVDALHFNRFGGTFEQLAASVDLVPLLQLCDGPVQRPASREELVAESRSERGVPGEGAFDLAALVAAFPAGTPVSVETPSDRRVAQLGEQGWARALKAAADAVLAAAEDLQEAGSK
ncbi:Xylose isomerase domain protein TIM barrel [Arthrobacter sp. FB24]|jgi:sugar phosphate isomerase/epimerase|uniref:sugar phosphate isomerase/epimerase family protein n=1 Tax=Arthrobacter sp. (strain FB24) TaxID=290399 RepID=UPI00005270BF|nr:TIM barrel protein [Arthrobacter sp. FB24]ABK04856.1 Xylose isomerase domain protein TIM barrel [Arthrobacter sp. FB24]